MGNSLLGYNQFEGALISSSVLSSRIDLTFLHPTWSYKSEKEKHQERGPREFQRLKQRPTVRLKQDPVAFAEGKREDTGDAPTGGAQTSKQELST